MRYITLLCLISLTLTACGEQAPVGAKKERGERTLLVESTMAQSGDYRRTIEAIGTLRAEHEVKLAVQQEGKLLQLPYHEGDRVTRGALLLQLDDTLLHAQLKKSRAQRLQAEQDLQRLKRLQGGRVVAEDELARAVTALDVARAEEEELQIQLQQTRVLAPFDGVISERLAEPGTNLARFTHVLTLIDDTSLYTELKLSELVLPTLNIGDNVSLGIDALGPQLFNGAISRIHPRIDEVSHQGTIEVRLDPVPDGAQAGQLCRVAVPLHSATRLLVPYNALRRDEQGEYLFVIDTDNRVERRTVNSGLHFEEMVEVLSGLTAGERIVTRGFLGLAPGRKVKPAEPATP